MHAIETRGLTHDFGGDKGLFDLTLNVPKRRVHGFLGPNGAGKTTAIRLLLGFLAPHRGGSRVLGIDPWRHASRVKACVGYIPGELALPPMLRGREFLEHSQRLRGDVDEAWRDQLIETFDAAPEQRIGTLSKGNKQKIALIDALQHRPELLIMDEPTDGLDPLLRDQVRQVLRDHVRAGGTVFMSSHIVHEIQTMCDDVSIVLSGRLREQATISDLVALEGIRVEVTVPDVRAAAAQLARVGVRDVSRRGNRIRLRVQGNPLPALAALDRLGATDPMLRQGDLEEMFLRLYAEDRT